MKVLSPEHECKVFFNCLIVCLLGAGMYTHNLHYFLNDQHYKIYSEHAQKYELHPERKEK